MAIEVDKRFTIFLIVFGIFAGLTLIVIIFIPFILEFCYCRRRKTSDSLEDQQELLGLPNEPMDEYSGALSTPLHNSNVYAKDTEVNCAIEYRTRGTQLLVGVATVAPAAEVWKLANENSNSKIFLIVYIDGDSLNSPCLSKMHNIKTSIDFNEIFVYTVMPYDLSSMFLIIQTVLFCGNWRYNIGTVKFLLSELNNNSNSVNKLYKLPYPEERSFIHDCLLSMSMTKSRSTIKLKVVKLYFLDDPSSETPLSGLHLRIQLTDFINPLMTMDTSKKMLQRCIVFNESLTFPIEKETRNSLELEIQLLESYKINEEEVESVCGRTVLYICPYNDASMSANNTEHFKEVFNNPEVEISRWHSIQYVRSNR